MQGLLKRLKPPAVSLMVILLQLSQAVAGSIRVTHEVNGRSSLNFRGTENIKTLVPAGTEGEVLERWALPSGNYGVKMRVTSLSPKPSSSNLQVGQELWVYYHRDEKRRLLELFDDQGLVVDQPEKGKWAVALQTFRVAAPKVNAAVCDSCTIGDPTEAKPISSIAAQIFESAQDIPTLDLGVEEIVTYLNRIKPQTETNRRIARAVLNEAKLNNISSTFVLGVIAAESAFHTSVDSHAGAMGLMQLMPAAWTEVMGGDVPRSYDIETNIRAGVRYLAKQLRLYNGDEMLALYAYKNGPGNANQFVQGAQTKSASTLVYEKNVNRFKANYEAYQTQAGPILASN